MFHENYSLNCTCCEQSYADIISELIDKDYTHFYVDFAKEADDENSTEQG